MGWRDPIVRVRHGKHDLSVLHPTEDPSRAILVRHGDLDLASSSSFHQRACDILYTSDSKDGGAKIRHFFCASYVYTCRLTVTTVGNSPKCSLRQRWKLAGGGAAFRH